MVSTTTRIQLITGLGQIPGTVSLGYLDVEAKVDVPVTYSVADIRDISKRSGVFSKTIKLPGTKNNNDLLGQLFDINIVQGTFDINKLQFCHLLQDNVPVVQNAYFQVIRVIKLQTAACEDEEVEYEVLIKDNASDFFTKLGQDELTDLDFSNFDHVYTAGNITGSFNHFQANGYKYLMPWTDTPLNANTPWYTIQDFKPAIYAQQYWDQIHEKAGYSYTWLTAGDPFVQFDRLLIPYNGDDKGLTTSALNVTKVVADRTGLSTITYSGGNLIGNWAFPVAIPVEIQDLSALYSASTSVYTVPGPLAAPSGIDFKFDIDFEVFFLNALSVKTLQNPAGFRPEIEVYNTATGQTLGTAPLVPNFTANYAPGVGPGPFVPQTLAIGTNTLYPATLSTVNVTVTNFVGGEPLSFRVRLATNGLPAGVQPSYGNNANVGSYIRINTAKVTINQNSQSQQYFSGIRLNDYVPKKIKQSDFIKSICLMYNLYVEPNANGGNNLVYKHRDAFYDSGALVDWTDKLDRGSDQTVSFLPELTKKRIILKYKDDSDVYNQLYLNTLNETYGQQEVVFSNEYVKDIDKKELIFSPTPMRPTSFGAIAPLIQPQAPSNNIRILIDNGIANCNAFTIENYPGNAVTSTNYPFLSHLNAVTNPSFDINFGVCDFYFYDIVNYTNNNLYNLFWKRTMGQINNGKMMTASFALYSTDIQKMRLNDKIRIDNSYWNINKIIDYNANERQLTRVELLSLDNATQLPRFAKTSIVKPNWYNEANPAPQPSVIPIKPPKGAYLGASNELLKRSSNSAVINSDSSMALYGRNNVIGPDFSGIIIGDSREISTPGLYIDDWALTPTGLQITGQAIIDPGVDDILPEDKVDPVDVIDGGLDTIRPFAGRPRTVTTRAFVDGGADSV